MTDRYERIRRALDAIQDSARGHRHKRELAHLDFREACDPDTIRELLAERDQLAAALEAAREDAERLDWLDANGSAVRLKGNSRRNLIIWGAMHVPSYRTIRHAIDQARGEEEGNGQ